jgi:hypothetical protein
MQQEDREGKSEKESSGPDLTDGNQEASKQP